MVSSDTIVDSPYLKQTSPLQAAVERRVQGAVSGNLERMSWARCRQVGNCLGLAFYAAGAKRRELAIANVRQALGVNRPKAMHIARRSAQNWGMTTCEFLHLPGASPQEIRDYVPLTGLENLQQALHEGKGAILLMAHIGNWEAIVARIAQECDLAGIVRPLSNGTAHKHMSDVRRSIGLSLISKHAAARPSLKHLRSGGALAILPDRHAGPDGALLPLFGHMTSFETAPARLAVMSGAPILPAFGIRRRPWLADGHIDGRILPALQVRQARGEDREAAVVEGTCSVIASLENIVRAHPDQWSWMLRRWRAGDLFCNAWEAYDGVIPPRGRGHRDSSQSSWVNPALAAATASSR